MSQSADKREIILHLISVPCDVPAPNRLRSVLKRLLRTYGFRCTRIAGDGLDDQTTDGPSLGTGERHDATGAILPPETAT